MNELNKNSADPSQEPTEQENTEERERLTIEVPTELSAGLNQSSPVCTCPPGCCC